MKTMVFRYRKKSKKVLMAAALFIPIVFVLILVVKLANGSTDSFNDPETGIIAVDPGHGGIDGGTGSEGFLEKEINLSISHRLKGKLEEKGFKVVLTRDSDVSLEDPNAPRDYRHYSDLSTRVEKINGSEAQLFLSIHVNSNVNNPKASGSIVFYGERFEESQILAGCIQHSLNLLETDSGIRDAHASRSADFFLLKNTRIPGVIIETGFITNYRERLLLAEDGFRERIAASIAEGVLAYYEKLGLSKPEPAGKTTINK